MDKTYYFDYNATTPTDPRVVDAMAPFFTEKFHNPSSFYRHAGQAFQAMEAARASVAALLHASAKEIIFTSGGTESDNLAIQGVAAKLKAKGNHLITTKIEHPAVLNTCQHLAKSGFEVTFLPVDRVGMVDPDALRQSIRPATILVSIMHANNEIGTIQPLKELIAITHEKGALFHSDAVQSTGKLPINVKDLDIDLLSFSSHKIYGPKGMGVLYVKSGVKLEPLLFGGGHERGLRSGTENVPGIIGLGKAAELAGQEMAAEEKRLRPLRDRLETEFRRIIPDIMVNGDTRQRLYNTLNLSIRFIEGEAMLGYLDQHGLALSSGSACSAKSLEPSHVLLAIGLSHEDAHGSLRISLGKYNQPADVDKLIEVLPPIVEKLRSMSPFWKKK